MGSIIISKLSIISASVKIEKLMSHLKNVVAEEKAAVKISAILSSMRRCQLIIGGI